jgi:hypothetical protein
MDEDGSRDMQSIRRAVPSLGFILIAGTKPAA